MGLKPDQLLRPYHQKRGNTRPMAHQKSTLSRKPPAPLEKRPKMEFDNI